MNPTMETFCENHNTKPLFNTPEAYEQFRQSFARDMRPMLEENRLARIKNEELAQRHRIC